MVLNKFFSISILIIFFSSFALAETSYTPYSEKSCENGVCILNLYSGIQFVNENNEWKTIDQAKSLKDSGYYLIVNYGKEAEDPKSLEIEDFNYTSVKLKNVDISALSKSEQPLSIKFYDEEGKEKTSQTSLITTKSSDVKKDFSLNWDFGDTIHLGNNSTIIILNSTNSGLISDTYVKNDSLDMNFAINQTLRVDDYTERQRAYFMFNLTSIPLNKVIIYANLSLHSSSASAIAISLFQVYGGFDENLVNWSSQPCGTDKSSILGNCNSTAETTVTGTTTMLFDITNLIDRAYTSNNTNVSFVITKLTQASSGYILIDSKESSTISYRPKISITYSDISIIDEACSNFTKTGFRLVMIIASLMIISFLGYFIYQNFGELTLGQAIMLFISVITSLALWQISGQNLGGICPVT